MSGASEKFTVFGFDSTHDAMRAETVLLSAGVDIVLIPTPRSMGTLCGFAARVPLTQADAAMVEMRSAGIEPYAAIETEDRTAP